MQELDTWRVSWMQQGYLMTNKKSNDGIVALAFVANNLGV